MFLDKIVMPRSRSMSLLSMIRSCVCWLALKTLLCLSIESTCISHEQSSDVMVLLREGPKAKQQTEKTTYQGGLAMVDMSNDGDVANVVFMCQYI